MVEDYYGRICALNTNITLEKMMSVILLQRLIPGGQNLAARALIKDAKGASLLHPDRIGCGAVMATINSAIIVLRSTPASMPI